VMYQALSGGVLDYQQQAQRRSLEQSKLKIWEQRPCWQACWRNWARDERPQPRLPDTSR
jgi:hypothetical protein